MKKILSIMENIEGLWTILLKQITVYIEHKNLTHKSMEHVWGHILQKIQLFK